MAKLRFEIDGKPSEVAFQSFVDASAHFLALLREIDQAMSGRHLGTLRWYVSGLNSNGGLAVEVLSKLKPPPKRRKVQIDPDIGGRVAGSLVTGFDNIENLGVSPPYLSPYGLQRLDNMLHVLEQNGARGYRTTDLQHDRTVTLTHKAIDNVRALLPIKRKTIGSVEGKLEAISIHRRKRFVVYDALTKKAITCEFRDDMLDGIKDSLGHRVLVSGTVHWNAKSEAKRVDVETIRPLGDQLPSTSELSGAYPDITEGMAIDEYIRSIRGDEGSVR